MKTSFCLSVVLTNTKRKNAKEVDRMTLSVYEGKDMNTATMQDFMRFIEMLVKHKKEVKYFTRGINVQLIPSKGASRFGGYYKETRRIYSIEQYINDLIDSFVLINKFANKKVNEDLLDSHNNVDVRKLIGEYYER